MFEGIDLVDGGGLWLWADLGHKHFWKKIGLSKYGLCRLFQGLVAFVMDVFTPEEKKWTQPFFMWCGLLLYCNFLLVLCNL